MNLKRLKQIKDNDKKVIVAKWIHAYCPRVDLSFIKDIVEYYWDNKFTVEQNTEKYAALFDAIEPCYEEGLMLSEILDKMTIRQRMGLIKGYLKPYKGCKIQSPQFGDVIITQRGINETAYQADLSALSTLSAMRLREVIETAVGDGVPNPPISHKQIYDFEFIDVYILFTDLEDIGEVKLVIGQKDNGLYLQYSCTSTTF